MQALQLFVVNVILFHNVVGGTGHGPTGIDHVEYTRIPAEEEVGQSDLSDTTDVSDESDTTDMWELFPDTYKNIYHCTVNLLALGMKKWLDIPPPERRLTAIPTYLGYSGPTINAIDEAMTELLDRQRGTGRWASRRMDDLSDAYYASCDMECARGFSDDDWMLKREMVETFQKFVTANASKADKNATEEELVNALNSYLAEIPAANKARRELRVTVGLMKNWMFFKPTEVEAVELLLAEVPADNENPETVDQEYPETIRQLAVSYSDQVIGAEVLRNHLHILRSAIPRLFLYAYDYVKIFLVLKKYELDQADMAIVESFSGFMIKYKSLFVYRYFAFRGPPSERSNKLFRNLKRLTEFCDPKSSTKREREDLPNVLNSGDYIGKKSDEDFYDSYAINLLNDTLDSLVESFLLPEDLEDAIHVTHYDIGTPKEICLELITDRIKGGLDILNEFQKYFADYI